MWAALSFILDGAFLELVAVLDDLWFCRHALIRRGMLSRFLIEMLIAIYVAAILARQLDAANDRLSRLSTSSKLANSLSVIGKTVEKVEEQLSYSGDASLVYAGYPYDPFRPDKSVH